MSTFERIMYMFAMWP